MESLFKTVSFFFLFSQRWNDIGDVADLKNPSYKKERAKEGEVETVQKESEEIIVHVKVYDVARPELTSVQVIPRKQP